MLKEVVKDYEFREDMSVDELVDQMEKAWGFTAGKVSVGVNILELMIKMRNCVKFLSFTGNLVATGTRGVFKEFVKRKLVDVVITTCGTLDHDMARCWKNYYKGSFIMNDAKLHEKGINRLGNVLVPNDSYGTIIEQKMQTLLENLWKEGIREVSGSQLCREIGKRRLQRKLNSLLGSQKQHTSLRAWHYGRRGWLSNVAFQPRPRLQA